MKLKLKSLIVLFVAPLSALGADALEKYRVPCSSSQQVEIQTAVAVAKDLAIKASAALPPLDSVGGKRFTRWFGGPEGDYDPVTKNVFDEVSVRLIFQKYWCLPPNSTTPDRWIHTNAFVPRGKVGEIFVLPSFFDLPTSGKATRGGTILHEVSHQSSLRVITDDDITGDGKNDYGAGNAELRAGKFPVKARANADNFKYFAEDVVFTIP